MKAGVEELNQATMVVSCNGKAVPRPQRRGAQQGCRKHRGRTDQLCVMCIAAAMWPALSAP